ncbi:MAG: hypothetical protein LW817_00325 [Candidatus Caenarcaniphilales bacterium]|jgi:antitoxin MazE|nr:hypothetical protein [Candidatus Caenarcaniphilales bacterium]
MNIDLSLINIGNSKGIRLPRAIIEACEFGDVINAQLLKGKLILSSAKKPREGWAQAFKSSNSKPKELIDESANEFDKEDWTW